MATPQAGEPLQAWLDEAARADVAAYVRLRAQALAAPGQTRQPLADLAASNRVGALTLIARAWLGWIDQPQLFTTVSESFDIEEAAPDLDITGRPPSAFGLSATFIRRAGPDCSPLLAEILFKTGLDWIDWRRETCFLALGRLVTSRPAETALLDLFVAAVDAPTRTRVRAILVDTGSTGLDSRLEQLMRDADADTAEVLSTLRAALRERPSRGV